MKLWHEKLIRELPHQQLLEQHMDCCTLRILGWNKKNATMHYVFTYSPYKLYQYHMIVMTAMKQKDYPYEPLWENPSYRGEACPPYEEIIVHDEDYSPYAEHDVDYLRECLLELAEKEIKLSFNQNH